MERGSEDSIGIGMPQLIRPTNVKVVSKDGEIQVSLTIDLNINLNGTVQAGVQEKFTEEPPASPDVVKEADLWMIPDFEPAEKIDFGRRE